jgi:hypothetical protein
MDLPDGIFAMEMEVGRETTLSYHTVFITRELI